jgi:pimeloyl-ACP methyl ester carboxylesterase
MPKVKVNDIQIYYEVHGNGFPLVLISAYGGNSEDWNLFAPKLRQLSKHYKVVTLDNRGTGRSSTPESDYSIKTMSDDVAGLLDSLRMPKAHILGQSMGSLIAQELAINHPIKVEGLILVCTTPGGSAYETIPGQKEALEKLKWTFAPPPGMSPQVVMEEIMGMCCQKEFFDKNKAELMTYMPKYPTPVSTLEKQYDAIMKFDTCDRLKKIRSRTLVIHGEEDKLCMPESARMLVKQIPNAKLKMFKQAGHLVLEEKWQETKTAILDFLEELGTN